MAQQLITKESFTSIQEAQAGLTRLFNKARTRGGFYRVLKNNKSLGVLIPDSVFDSLLEDLEALSSPSYLKSIEKARSSNKRISVNEVKNELGM